MTGFIRIEKVRFFARPSRPQPSTPDIPRAGRGRFHAESQSAKEEVFGSCKSTNSKCSLCQDCACRCRFYRFERFCRIWNQQLMHFEHRLRFAPLPAPDLNNFRINSLQTTQNQCAHSVPKFPSPTPNSQLFSLAFPVGSRRT